MTPLSNEAKLLRLLIIVIVGVAAIAGTVYAVDKKTERDTITCTGYGFTLEQAQANADGCPDEFLGAGY